jgi:transcriptional regulator with XRE-family HTH domain
MSVEQSDKRGASGKDDPDRDRDLHQLSEENVALRLAWEMRRRGWSQERMAQELTNAGCPTHQSAISKIVNSKPDGSRRAISVNEAIAMAHVFGIPIEELPLPPEGAEGRDLHNLSRIVTQEGRDARERSARFILAWARLRYRLSLEENQAAYKEFLSTRRVDNEKAGKAIETWLDADPYQGTAAAYDLLERTLQVMGNGRDLTPPTQDRRWRHSIVADLLRLRDLFGTRIPGSQVRAVPELVQDFASVLLRTRMLDLAAPVIDSYERGEAHPTHDVVAEIASRLQQIIDRAPRDRLDYLESLAARIGLRWKGGETKEEQEELAAQLGATSEDYTDAKKVGGIYRDIRLR